MIGIFFLIIVPVLSIQIELNNVHHQFKIIDSFNLLYVIFKFPVWWMIGIVNIYLIKIKVKKYI
ncbi:hypothetical protein SAMN05421639_104518 [Chryseobacterium shigense]|uniref:Uncharacterized protein n=1 Tax=Chryseobacterium shigense TaxID=297244 RepID=A0A1N7ISR0_9FLAO|nr:hypothetical protein SAMN05421639_104518 [Chryseobacterium shigense]